MTTSPEKPRVLTGDTPTGSLHLGHYVGSIENRLAMQDEYDCYVFVANVHALTTRADDVASVRADTISIVKDWLSCGIDPNKTTLFLQSEIPAVAELTWYFAMLLGYGRLMKNPTVKDEIRVKNLGENYSFGFLMYPVGQIADILAFRPQFVPVGEDQIPHIEMTREVARRFDQLYCGVDPHTDDAEYASAGGVFPIPAAKTGRVSRLTGLDGVNKMSKSLGNAIFLTDEPRQVQKKCNKIFTGRGSMDDPPILENNTILEYLKAFHTDPARVEELTADYAASKLGDGHLKKEAATAINAFLDPIRARRARITDDDVIDILKAGTAKANTTAEQTLWQAKQAAKFDFFERDITLR
ncbi:tryptophan--tRNA ligase [Planctomycetales bacterium ZRK34]|nr:tryptophan--tRNA ligase [Planctomycetales bacterium ZRK34]